MKLFVVADDFGISKARSDGIVEVAQQGKLSAASLMLNGLASQYAVDIAKSVRLPLGLHFNCSEGPPVSTAFNEPNALTTTIKQHQAFPGKNQCWEILETANEQLIDSIEIEFRAQFNKFVELTGYLPHFYNGHQHVHVHPRLASRLAKSAKMLGCSMVRCPTQDPLPAENLFLKKIADCANSATSIFSKNSIEFIPAFIGLSCTDNCICAAKLKTMLEYVQGDCCELMLHPGRLDSSWDEYSASKEREREMEFLLSTEFEEILRTYPLKRL